MSEITSVLEFWFAPGREEVWFEKNADFDRAVRDTLAQPYETAAANGFEHWRASAQGCLALCLLLDQVPRNLFRGDPRAFATDPQARAVTRHALAQGYDRSLTQVERCFLYMPLEHSEDLVDQTDSCALMASLDERPEWHDYAVRHRDIIARFGRFPHRNETLGRASSAEEQAFLQTPNSCF